MADISSVLGSVGIGGAIGKAIVQLELDSKKYAAEMKAAQGQTVTSTNAMGQSVSKFSALGKQAFLAVGVAAVAGLAYSVKAAIEANDALLKLQNTFENNANLADRSVEAFTEQAEAIQLVTGSSDEAILTAQALLGQFSVTGEQVMTLTPLIVDLSEKMGIDMTAAAKSVGKAVEGNTSGLQRYGIVIDEASGKGGEFDAVLKGLEGTVGGFAEQRGQEEPWRILAAQFDELAESVGNALIPILKSVSSILLKLGPVLNIVGDHANEVLLIFGGYAAIRFLPPLLGSIAAGFEGLSLAMAGVSVGGGFLGNLGALVGALPQIALNAPMAAAGIVEVWEAMHPQGNFATPLIEANVALTALSEQAQGDLAYIAMHFDDAGRSAGSFQANVDRINESLAQAGIKYTLTTGALEGLVDGQSLAGLGAGALTAAQEALNKILDQGGKAAHRFGFQSKSAFQDFKSGVEESVEVGIGQFASLGEAFDTTPRELQKALNLAITIARREQRTLADIMGDDTLSKATKRALAAMPSNYRDAWSEAGKAGKRQLEQDAVTLQKLNERKFKEITKAGEGPAKEGGKGLGAAIMSGSVLGVDQHSDALERAVRDGVERAIQGGIDQAEAHSPSRRMFELGVDLMAGLQNGITDHEQDVIDAAQKVIDKAIKEMEKQADALQSRLDKIIAKADEMKSSVQGGFSSFLDITGAFAEGQDIGAFFQAQLAGAQEFAKVLKQLQKAGASSALLQQIAQAGPEAMPFAQQLLASGTTGSISDAYQQIADLAGKTADQLSNAYFGEKIDALQSELKGIREELRTLNQPRRLEIAFRPGADNALRHLIIQIIGEIGLSKAPL